MITKLIVAFSILALVAAVAGTPIVKVVNTHVRLSAPAVLGGTTLKAGDYRLTLTESKATLTMGKESHEFAVKVTTGDRKYEQTEVTYQRTGAESTISAISLGGTKTKLTFD